MMLYESFFIENHRFEVKIDDFLVFERLPAALRFFTFFASLCATLARAFVPYKPIAWPNQRYHLIEHALM